jgi:hypothetical protein
MSHKCRVVWSVERLQGDEMQNRRGRRGRRGGIEGEKEHGEATEEAEARR